MPTDGYGNTDCKAPSNPPPPILPPVVEGDENGDGDGGEKNRRKREKTTCNPEHWGKSVEAMSAILLVVITGAYTIFAWHQWREMKETNRLTRVALSGSDTTLQKTLGKMQAQIEQMSRLADNAKDQADQTKTISQLTRESLTSIERPFVTVDKLVITPNTTTRLNGIIADWKVRVIVNNSGRTPTQNLHYKVASEWIPRHMWTNPQIAPIDPTAFPSASDIRTHKYMTRGILGAQSTTDTIGATTIKEVILNESPTVNAAVFTFGVFTYGDVINRNANHITEFCFILLKAEMPTDETLSYAPCAHHNCADDECKTEN